MRAAAGRCLGLAAVLVAALGLLVSSSSAAAATPGCASAPAPYTGTDATVAAVTQLDADEDQNCAAVLAELSSDVGSNHSDLQAIAGDLVTGQGAAQNVSVTNWPGDQTVGLDSSSEAFADSEAAGLHVDLWVLIGCVVGALGVGVLVSRLWP